MKIKLLVPVFLCVLLARASSAGWTPLQMDFGPYLRIASTNADVYGLRLGLFSESHDMYGASVSFWSDTIAGNGGGLQLALLRNTVSKNYTGIQAALFANEVRDTFTGISLALVDTSRIVHGVTLGLAMGVEEPVYFFNNQLTGQNEQVTEELVGVQAGFACWAGRVMGMQIAFWSLARESVGLTCGFFLCQVGDVAGVTAGAFSLSSSMRGIQVGGLFASAEDSMKGLQIGGLGCYAAEACGLQIGGVCFADDTCGLQIGGFNRIKDGRGLQIGAINWTANMTGLQIGIINVTESLHGLQIGLFNVVNDSSPSFMPLANVRF